MLRDFAPTERLGLLYSRALPFADECLPFGQFETVFFFLRILRMGIYYDVLSVGDGRGSQWGRIVPFAGRVAYVGLLIPGRCPSLTNVCPSGNLRRFSFSEDASHGG